MILLLGLGNILLSDEGLGVRVIEELGRDYEFPEEVNIIDGGTGAFFLLPYLEQAVKVLVIDAVKMGKSPGSIYELTFEECLLLPKEKLSLHEISFSDLLFLLQLRGKTFDDFVLLGVEPANIEPGDTLSEEVKMALPKVIERILCKLKAWGVNIRSRKLIH